MATTTHHQDAGYLILGARHIFFYFIFFFFSSRFSLFPSIHPPNFIGQETAHQTLPPHMALQFRFRFEIEGVVTSWASRPSPLPSHPGHQLALVADALEGANIACHTVSPRSSALRYRDPDTWNVDSAGMVEGRIIDAATLDSEDSDSDSSSDWRPSPWSSQGPTLPPRRRNGFVLVSPFFYTPDNRWKGMMRHALVTLGSTVRWEVDWTTGLRIHLHNAERWFTDEELMRLALFCCRFEGNNRSNERAYLGPYPGT